MRNGTISHINVYVYIILNTSYLLDKGIRHYEYLFIFELLNVKTHLNKSLLVSYLVQVESI